MGLGDKVKKAVANAKDTVNETRHRAGAKIEELRREITHGTMQPNDRARSVARQTKEELQADIARAKREVRNTEEY